MRGATTKKGGKIFSRTVGPKTNLDSSFSDIQEIIYTQAMFRQKEVTYANGEQTQSLVARVVCTN